MILQYVKTDYKNVGNYLTYKIEMPGPNAMQELIKRAKDAAAAKATSTTATKVKPVKSDPVKPK
jgi:hypothetical protein